MPIFEKQNFVKDYERSVFQLLSVLGRNKEKYIINNFKCIGKTHSKMDEKKFIPLYVEHLQMA